jgi:prefoldin alpha subunit
LAGTDRDRIAMEANYLRQQAEEINAQSQQLSALLAENQAAQASLDALAKAGAAKSSEAWLSPIGAGVFCRAKPSGESVVVEIGSRVARETTPAEAKAILAERAQAIEKAIGEARAALTQTLRRMDELGALAEMQ